MPHRITMWMCGYGCYETYRSKASCALHEESCWLNPARKPLGLLPRGILPGDRVGWEPTGDGFFRRSGELICYTDHGLGAYVWIGSGTAFVDVEKMQPIQE